MSSASATPHPLQTELARARRVESLLTETNRAARVGSWDYDLATGALYWSAVTKEIHEVAPDFEPDVATGVRFYREGYSRTRVAEVLQRAIDTGEGWDEELELTTATGKHRWVRAVGRAVREAGKTVRVFGSFQDVHEQRRTRLRLERHEQLLRVTNEGARIGWWETVVGSDEVTYSVVVNEIMGYQGELVWKNEDALKHFVPSPETDRLIELYARCLQYGEPYECDFRVYHVGGGEVWVRSRGRAELEGERPVRIVGSFQDIHEEKQLELRLRQSERLMRSNFELAPHGMVIASPEGYFEEVSPSFTEMLGYTLADLAGKRFPDITHPGDRARDAEAMARIADGTVDSFRTEKRYIHKDGSTVWADLAVAVLRDADGAPLRLHAQLVDTTEQRQAALRQQRIAFLEAKAKEMEQFAYIASHDLRQPVLTIQGYVEALVEDFGDRLDGEATRYLDVVQGALGRIDNMIKGLLDYSRLSKAKQLQHVDLDALVAEVVTDLDALIKQTGGEVEVHALTPVMGYPIELRQLFQNLIANALQYHRPGVAPRVEVGCEEIAGGHQFWVKDNGVGIRERDFERIFALFQRAGRKDGDSGTGIGLASCRTIVERHGGTIWVESALGEGSTFHFTVLDEPSA